MRVRKSFFGTADAWGAGVDAPVNAAVPKPDRAIGVRKWPLTAEFQETPFIAEPGGKHSVVKIIAVDAAVVHGMTVEQFESPNSSSSFGFGIPYSRIFDTVPMNQSGWHGQPGMLITGVEMFRDVNTSVNPLHPDGFGSPAGMPPYAAQVPTASAAIALRPKRSVHLSIVTGAPASDPIDPYIPFCLVGIAPSTTSTYLPAYFCAVSFAASIDSDPVAAINVP